MMACCIVVENVGLVLCWCCWEVGLGLCCCWVCWFIVILMLRVLICLCFVPEKCWSSIVLFLLLMMLIYCCVVAKNVDLFLLCCWQWLFIIGIHASERCRKTFNIYENVGLLLNYKSERCRKTSMRMLVYCCITGQTDAGRHQFVANSVGLLLNYRSERCKKTSIKQARFHKMKTTRKMEMWKPSKNCPMCKVTFFFPCYLLPLLVGSGSKNGMYCVVAFTVTSSYRHLSASKRVIHTICLVRSQALSNLPLVSAQLSKNICM